METSPRSQLDQALAAFARGDYAHARRLAAPLVDTSHSAEDAESDDASISQEARELLVRLTPHRITKLFFLLTLALLTAVTFFAYSR
jgi:hypothetical protein